MTIEFDPEKFVACMTEDHRQELAKALLGGLTIEMIIGALLDDDDTPTQMARDVSKALMEVCGPDENEITADEADRLHLAIVEGRRQDAIDLLNEITGIGLRSVREQRNLFPDRVPQ